MISSPAWRALLAILVVRGVAAVSALVYLFLGVAGDGIEQKVIH